MSGADDLPNLASERLGAAVLWASDDFFAEKENLIRDREAEWREHEYTDRGKWMDGWESRRKRDLREGAHDAAIVRLAMPGVIRSIVVDTSFFRGNFPEHASIEGTTAPEGTRVAELLSERAEWIEIVSKSALSGNAKNVFEVTSPIAFTHLRLRIHPDGGVARLRVRGTPFPDWTRIGGARSTIDLVSLECGAEVISCSDMFFGPKHNLIQPGRARNMSDGWETKRRRGVTPDTHDWVLVKLAGQGMILRVEIDTAFFLGNFPDTALLEGCNGDPETAPFEPVLVRTELMGHTRHVFVNQIVEHGPFTHLRLKVFPDGGVSRLRAFGELTAHAREDAAARAFGAMSPRVLAASLRACCTSRELVETIARERPFSSGKEMLARIRAVVSSLGESDLMEAFAGHPRVGQASAEDFSREEQSTARGASKETLAALDEANRAYEAKHGFVFLIFATGKTADEILDAAKKRVQNTREIELKTAAKELAEIAALRAVKLVGG